MIGLDQGKPCLEITSGGSPKRAAAGEAIAADGLKHLGVISADGKSTLYVDGKAVGLRRCRTTTEQGLRRASAGIAPPLSERSINVGNFQGGPRRRLSQARAAVSQSGTDKAGKLLVPGGAEASEGGGGGTITALEHVMLFGDIAKNMMFDGWLVSSLPAPSWPWSDGSWPFGSFSICNKSAKGDDTPSSRWRTSPRTPRRWIIPTRTTMRSMGGKVDARTQKQLATSPIYHDLPRRLRRDSPSPALDRRVVSGPHAAFHSGHSRQPRRAACSASCTAFAVRTRLSHHQHCRRPLRRTARHGHGRR